MKSRPILFSGPMVRALLNGTKTQTRRIVKPQPTDAMWDIAREHLGGDTHDAFPDVGIGGIGLRRGAAAHKRTADRLGYTGGPGIGFVIPNIMCPYGQPGDLLWVRESIIRDIHGDPMHSYYAADETYTVADAWPWQRDILPSIHCPRGLSRITLEINGIHVERLNEISEADAKAEGIICDPEHWSDKVTAIDLYSSLWEEINGHGSWDANPYVWVIEFKRIEQ